MSESYVRNVIEAALLAAGTPLPVAELTRLFEDSARPSAQQVRAALAALAAEYSGRGIELKETANGALPPAAGAASGGDTPPSAGSAPPRTPSGFAPDKRCLRPRATRLRHGPLDSDR